MIAVYIVTDNMTRELHAEGRRRLRESGANESAMKIHSCFGEDGKLAIFDIWESQEAFDSFLEHLLPILSDLGITASGPPSIMQVVDLVL